MMEKFTPVEAPQRWRYVIKKHRLETKKRRYSAYEIHLKQSNETWCSIRECPKKAKGIWCVNYRLL